jgi:hypothetical protein
VQEDWFEDFLVLLGLVGRTGEQTLVGMSYPPLSLLCRIMSARIVGLLDRNNCHPEGLELKISYLVTWGGVGV